MAAAVCGAGGAAAAGFGASAAVATGAAARFVTVRDIVRVATGAGFAAEMRVVRTVRLTDCLAVVIVAGVDVSVAGAVVVVSVAGAVVSGVGWTVAGAVVAGAAVVGWASCARAGVEESASAAIAGRARVDA